MKTFSMTDIGRRRGMNQDYIYTSETPVGNLPNLFIVADGMGGHNAGDFASRYTVEYVVKAIAASTLCEPAARCGRPMQTFWGLRTAIQGFGEWEPRLWGPVSRETACMSQM